MDTQTLIERLDETLEPGAYADVDASENGLQIGAGEGTVERAAFAVDAAVQTIDAAADWDADLLVVHHGLSWGGIDRVTGRTYDRVAGLIEAGIDLYVSHLPLDGHQELGNAAGIADLLGLQDRSAFGELGPVTVGQRGTLPEPLGISELAVRLEGALDHGGDGIQVLDVGRDRIEAVAIVTGSGADWYDEALEADVDAFITGEGKGKLYHMARESGIPVFLGGHYATETFGIEALADVVAELGPETRIIEAPTGL